MDSLHAPWRIEYILAPKPPPNGVSLFTRIAQSSDDEANHVLARDRTCFALLNTYPYTGGHLMVVPYRQVRSEEHTSELQSRSDLVCRLLLEKKKKTREDSNDMNEHNRQLRRSVRQ